MGKKYIFLFIALISFSFLLLSFSDGDRNTKAQGNAMGLNTLSQNFLSAALPRYDWSKTNPFGNIHRKISRTEKRVQESISHTPWAQDFVVGNTTGNLQRVLNRWPDKQNIEVAFYWPPSKGPFENWTPTEYMKDRYDTVVKPQIVSLKEAVGDATGLDFSVIERDEETTESYGKIRIILREGISPRNHFKVEPEQSQAFVHSVPSIGDFQKYIENAVRFTPLSRSQVDGYYFTNENHSINFAVCILNASLPDNLLKLLVTECVVRALGFPEEVQSSAESSILSAWNSQYDEYSERYVLDGAYNLEEKRKEIYKKMDQLKKSGQASREELMEMSLLAADMKIELITLPDYMPVSSVEAKVSDIDFNMLSLLYCDDVQAGMGAREVAQVLLKPNNCLNGKNKE